MKRIGIILFVTFLIGSTNSYLHPETTKVSTMMYVGSFGSFIQVYGESVFDVILEKLFDKKTLAKIEPFKPKKEIEKTILNQINNELNDYNLAFGDLFMCKFTIDNKNIFALVLVYGTLEPTIRYYHMK